MKHKMWWLQRSSWPHYLARWLMLFATTGYVFLPTSMAWANPAGEQVVGGAATFHRQGNNLTVNQTTDRLAVNWQDFSIAAGERTHFSMPSAASVALNRVLGGNPSQIYGTLSSNGNIILVNNAGIFVGPGGVVNAASFVGSTLDIDPGQFMNGGQRGHSLQGDSYAPIVNQGSIKAEKGDVFLIAQKVENRGTISAPNGRAALVGVGRAVDRTEVVLHEVGGSGFAVRVAQLEGEAAQGMKGELPDGEELLNEGDIAAAQAELSASGNIYALAIRNSGTIKAKAVVAQADGTVRLDGGLGDVRNTGTLIAKNAGDEATAAGGQIEVTGQNITATPESIITAAGGRQGGSGGRVKIDSQDTTIVQGQVDVAAPAANAQGGKVELLGERVGLFEEAKVDASGGTGGGKVLVGGDYLGGNTPAPELTARVELEDEPVKNAKATVMAETAEIKADAKVNGDGGKIILWSDEYTGFYGELFARGGAEGGNGGFVETSSKNILQAFGSVSANAQAGRAGMWLLDPFDVTISAAATGGGAPNPINPGGGTWIPTAVGSNINAGDIEDALEAGNNVTVTTGFPGTGADPGDITVAAAIDASAGPGAGSLSLQAANDITVNASAPISILGNLTLNAQAGRVTVRNRLTAEGFVLIQSGIGVEITGGGIDVSGANPLIGRSSGLVQIEGGAGGILSRSDIILADPAGLVGAGAVNGLLMTAVGDISVFVSTPYVLPATGGWVLANLAGPPIAAQSTTGDISISNTAGIAPNTNPLPGFHSTLTVGTLQGIIGVNALAGDVNLNAGGGNLILGLASVRAAGSFTGISTEPTAGIIFAGPSERLTPAVASGSLGAGNQTYRGLVTLNAAAAVAPPDPLVPNDGRGVTYLANLAGGSSIVFEYAINDGSVPNATAGKAAGDNLALTGNERLVLLQTVGGTTDFYDYVGTFRGRTSANPVPPVGLFPAAIVQSAQPLYSFRQEGGGVEFWQLGTAASPEVGTRNGPSIYVQDPEPSMVNPARNGAGSVFFNGANLQLGANTYITGAGDINFGGTVESFLGQDPALLVATTQNNNPLPDGQGGGQVLFNGAVGGNNRPLGGLIVRAEGFRDELVGGIVQRKDSQILIDAAITTSPGVNPAQSGAFGQVELRADGALVLSAAIDTSSAGAAVPGVLTGDVSLVANLAGRDDAPENIIQLAANITTAAGDVTFGDPGIPDVLYRTGRVLLGALSTVTTSTTSIGGRITFLDAVDGPFRLNLGSNLGISLRTVGGSIPLGSLFIQDGEGVVTLEGNITTAGTDPTGAGVRAGSLIRFGAPVEVAVDDIVFNTTALGNANGGNLTFLNTLDAGTAALANIAVRAGGAGGIVFGGDVGGVNRPNSLAVESGAAGISVASTVDVLFGLGTGKPYAIDITPVLTTTAGETLKLDALGGILLRGGANLTVQGFRGGNLELTSLVEIKSGGTISVSGGDRSTGGPGFDAGTLTLTAPTILTGLLQANGGDAQENLIIGGKGGNAGIIILGSTGNVTVDSMEAFGGAADGNGQGGDAGTITVTIDGVFITGGVLVYGGAGREGGGGGNGGTVEFTASSLEVGNIVGIGGIPGFAGPLGGKGATVELVSTLGSLTLGQANLSGGDGPTGGSGGSLSLRTAEAIAAGLLNTSGGRGTGANGLGGDGGNITIIGDAGLVAPTLFLTSGGNGVASSGIGNGEGGSVTLTATTRNLTFRNPSLTMVGNGKLTLKTSAPTGDVRFANSLGGAVQIVMNSGLPATKNPGQMEIQAGRNLEMTSGSSVQSNGGLVQFTAGNNATLRSITTSSNLRNSGSLQVTATAGALLVEQSALITAAGQVDDEVSIGFNGGDVSLTGASVSVYDILTMGGNNSATSVLAGQGGVGGTIRITATAGDVILRGGGAASPQLAGLDSSGGNAIGTAPTTGSLFQSGGPGGEIILSATAGEVFLQTGDSLAVDFYMRSIGGGRATGSTLPNGTGGNITVLGNLRGDVNSSYNLILASGSGTVTLGRDADDTITLGTLVTAADDVRSTGTIRILGDLQAESVTTFGRGYSVELLGGATIGNNVTFLNTGIVRVGLDKDSVTTFRGGLNTSDGATRPSSLNLAGLVVSGNPANPGSGAGLTFGVVQLLDNTSLDSNGNNITIGKINGTTLNGQNLTLKRAIGTGEVSFGTKVGGEIALNEIAIEGGLSANDMTQVTFGDEVIAVSITSGTHSAATFSGNVTLAGNATLNGTTVLNNGAEGELLRFRVEGAGPSEVGTLILESEPGGLGVGLDAGAGGELRLTKAITGAVNLVLAGAGLKNFQGAVSVGTGTGASIQLNEGSATFFSLTTASAITSKVGTTGSFLGNVNLGAADSTPTDFNGTVNLGSITFNSNQSGSASPVRFDGNVELLGNATLTGVASYRLAGSVEGQGASRTLTLSGSGEKAFLGAVGGGGLINGIQQADSSGRVTFSAAVTTSGDSTFRSLVGLGPTFTAKGGTTTFTSASRVSAGNLTLSGGGNFVFHSSVSSGGLVTFNGPGARTFHLGMTATGLTQQAGAGRLTLSGTTDLGGGDATLIQAALENASLTAGEIFINGAVRGGGTTRLAGDLLVLGGGNQLLARSGTMTIETSGVRLDADAALGGAGNLIVRGAVNGLAADTRSLTLVDRGTKSFLSALGATTRLASLTQNAGSGTVTFNGNISVRNNATFNENVVLNGMGLTSAVGSVTFGGDGTDLLTTQGAASLVRATGAGQGVVVNSTVSLNSALTVEGRTATLNRISGSTANLNIRTDSVVLNDAISTGAGKVTVAKANGSAITLGGSSGGNFLTATDLGRFVTSGGVDVVTSGDIQLDDLTQADTAGITGPLGLITDADLFVIGAVSLNSLGGAYDRLITTGILDTGGFINLTLRDGGLAYDADQDFTLNNVSTLLGVAINTTGAMAVGGAVGSILGSVSLTATDLASSGNIRSSTGNVFLTASGGGMSSSGSVNAAGTVGMTSGGNLRVSGAVAGAAVLLNPAGNLVANGATFSSPDIRALTQDFFAFFPGSAGIAGTRLVIGATSLGQLGPNEIGVAVPLLAGAGGPYISEFTTGTGQPYILATQENAVPAVMMPATYTVSGAFPTRVSYSAEELEMMTPEERSAYEAGQRRESARVILERQPEQAEVGVPAEGEIPQAKASEPAQPAPTAQVILDGKPLAGKSEKEKGDSSQLLRIRPAKAVALRPEMDVQGVIEGERMAAEVNVGSAPVAGAGR